MHYQEQTVAHQVSQNHQSLSINNEIRQDWINYIINSNYNSNPASISNQYRLALTEKMHQLKIDGRKLFHMSITYKPYASRTYTEKDINRFFINFYTKHFLPHLLNTKNIHTNIKKSIQPITYAFVDEHEMNAVKKTTINATSRLPQDAYEFPIRLHHHIILAMHPDTLKRMETLIGTNTIATSEFSPKIMTSDIKECEAMRLLYASKMMKQYPDFLSFPDSLVRHHRH